MRISVVEEISAEDFGYAEDEMEVRDCLDHFLAEPFPEFHEGDIIVINPYLKPEHNDYVVVCNEEGEALTFKQLKKFGRARVLHPLNPKYDDIELTREIEYRIIGVVIEKKKR